jgi:hypothetical protein
MSLPSKLQKVAAPTRTYVGQTIQPNWSDHGQYRKSGYWFRIDGIWYHKSTMRAGEMWSANIIITKDSDGVFKYVKCRGKNRVPNQPLNEEELKEMAWIILSAEKA